ncbi:hypothetical protein P872_15810 [Rhodonellum psychrophilum GCM71 = DSM 17998]|uniref:Glycosyl transferase family 1 domain-containing protein n=2 Tax=Rhodonellum TaxID=336827 RepID=U5C7R5_9BACT|nr:MULTISPECIES: glycosyltransferase family 4 protein [Rhodonellum]ERM84247.1 hypothetical protein P872_15810 [Rhodonellum psychrophilum GCM71 = DSM 17998]SDZ18301.1 Glycosyltransferase involved in cell wall bisynthesis [Rhodonellum ikkaensis]
MKKPKILFVTPSFQSFITNDIQILSENHEVVVNSYSWRNKRLAPLFLVQQFFFVLRNILSIKFIFISFGGYWSFFPTLLGKIFGKPAFIVLHGTDCASIPELNYGSLRIPILKWVCKKSYEWATCLFPVSASLVKTENDYFVKGNRIKNGFQHHFPEIKTEYHIIPNGLDIEFWQAEEKVQREEKSFLTVMSADQFVLKGGDLICDMAGKFPDCRFYFAGLDAPKNQYDLPENIFFLGKLKPAQLKSLYSKIRFYFQLSVFEGFGCALCEAMLCGCIPIGSKVNILPDIIGQSGYLIEHRDPELLQTLMNKALISKENNRLERIARERIVSDYPLENRKKQLLSYLPH